MSDARAPAGPGQSLAREVAAWLETVAASSDTRRGMPRSTIIPTLVHSQGGGRHALHLLEQLSALSPTASAQLRTGGTIGQGGMGVVRLAEQVALGRMVAVKTLKPERRDERDALDLLREAWVTGSLEHPNIVPVHYLGLDEDGRPLIVLKRIEGADWSDLIDDPAAVAARFGAEDLLAWNLEILLQVLNAVRFAHSRGIIHRDLKPGNVMVGEFGEVYLLDWGLALALADDGSGRLPLARDATDLAGTPCYMAPEMLGDRGPLTERTDVYLAGAVLFEIITGEPPHTGTSAPEIIGKVATSTPVLPPGAPAELGRICLRAMAREPDERFASIDELRRAIQHYLGHRGSARLAERAQVRLDELRAVVARPIVAPPPPPPDADADDSQALAAAGAAEAAAAQREQVHRLFGACRFGFHEALVAWRDNEEARAGLERATVAVAEYELACDDPRAALGLLQELDAPPPALLARVRAAVDERARRDAALERLRALHDVKIGTRTRTFVAVVLGVLFTAVPFLLAVAPDLFPRIGYQTGLAYSAGFFGVVLALGVWARESLLATRINQRSLAMALFLFVAQTGLYGIAWAVAMPIVATELMMMFLWFVIVVAIVITIDLGLVPTAIGHGLGLVIATTWPEHRYHVMAAGNLVFTVNAFVLWRPEQIFRTAEERAAELARRARRARRAKAP